MTIDQLKITYQECLTNPNYQYKDMDETERFKLAVKSFQRLTPEQQKEVQQSWAKALGVKALTEEDIKDALRYRFLAQTNLYFLCKLLVKYNETTLRTHEEICNSFFISKDPTVSFRTFADAYQGQKEGLLMTPRGGFKSSLDIADCVQWVICFPEITVLIMTATLKLASMFIGELKEHFKMTESRVKTEKGKKKFEIKSFRNEATGQWMPSLFQSLFVEHCIMPDDGLSTEFQTNACAPIDKEPTAMAASIEQTLAGLHYGILKLDDVVSNENSNTATRMEEVNKQVSISKGMLHPYGFIDYIGTWYDDADLYGQMLKYDDDFVKEENTQNLQIGSIASGRFNSTASMRIYVRACWWLTEAANKAGKVEAECKEEDYELWFPERLPFKKLKKIQKSDKHFAIKYLNNPRLIHQVKFPRELMVRRTVDHQQLPQQGNIVMVVDVAYSVKSWADYTVIMVGLIHAGRFYVIDMNRGRFNEYQMPVMIANMAMKWKPKRIAMEDSVGAKWIGKETRRELDKLRILIPIEYIGLGKGSAASSKQVKAQPVLRLLGDERLFFSKGCADLEVIYEELERFGQGTAAHDDIVSGVSLMVQHFGPYADIEIKQQQSSMSLNEDREAVASRDQYNMIYGMGKYYMNDATNSNMAHDDHPSTQFEAMKGKTEVVHDVDPLADIFV